MILLINPISVDIHLYYWPLCGTREIKQNKKTYKDINSPFELLVII